MSADRPPETVDPLGPVDTGPPGDLPDHHLEAPTAIPPVLGRPSPAASRPARLRRDADAASASYRADGGDGGGWSVRAASVAGVRHRLAGRGPEDAYAWRVVEPDTSNGDGLDRSAAGGPSRAWSGVVLAIADGVGGVEGSAAASAAAVTAACEAAVVELAGPRHPGAAGGIGPDDGCWRAAFAAADAAALRAGGATTLVLAVLGADRCGAVGRIGDSTALVLDQEGWRECWPPAAADDGPVSTATAALPVAAGSTPAIEVVALALPPGTVLVLATDGIANPLRDGPSTVAPALAQALAEPPSPLGLAVLVDFSRQGCFDDRTLVGLWPFDPFAP